MILVDLSKMTSGFCDRLRAVTFGITIHKLYYRNEKKIIKLIEKKNNECPFLISDICYIQGFRILKTKHKNKNDFVISMTPYNSDLTKENVQKHHNSKKYSDEAILKSWIKSYNLIHCNKKIKTIINKIYLPKKFFSIHIRSTDKLVSTMEKLFEIPSKPTITFGQMNYFINNILDLINKNTKNKNVYIASDSEIYRLKIIKLLKKNNYNIFINNSSFVKKKLRQTSATDFGVDLFCLKQSSLILSSTGGGVPNTANLMSKKNKHINFLKNTELKERSLNIYMTKITKSFLN